MMIGVFVRLWILSMIGGCLHTDINGDPSAPTGAGGYWYCFAEENPEIPRARVCSSELDAVSDYWQWLEDEHGIAAVHGIDYTCNQPTPAEFCIRFSR